MLFRQLWLGTYDTVGICVIRLTRILARSGPRALPKHGKCSGTPTPLVRFSVGHVVRAQSELNNLRIVHPAVTSLAHHERRGCGRETNRRHHGALRESALRSWDLCLAELPRVPRVRARCAALLWQVGDFVVARHVSCCDRFEPVIESGSERCRPGGTSRRASAADFAAQRSNPWASELQRALREDPRTRMPPAPRISPYTLTCLRRWPLGPKLAAGPFARRAHRLLPAELIG